MTWIIKDKLSQRWVCIEQAPSGTRVGQAVLMSHWQYEDGTHGGPGAPVDEGELEPAGRCLS